MQFLCTILVALWTCLVACFRLTFAIILPLQSHCAWFGSELDPFGNVGSALPFLQNDWHQVTAPPTICLSVYPAARLGKRESQPTVVQATRCSRVFNVGSTRGQNEKGS